jgi:oxygen-independent coproporphyrinogen-3 oxidase
MSGIYFHIPFCKQACHYCDFHFSTLLKNKIAMFGALRTELELRKQYLGNDVVQSVYFGGGTPSLIETEEVSNLLNEVHKHYPVVANAEITLEANPDDLDSLKLSALKDAGINRLSIGIQSFSDTDLKFMNRAHSASQAIECVRAAQEAGFENISIDLIYGVPTLDDQQWVKNLETAFSLGVNHLSCYSLTVEPRTALAKMIRDKKVQDVNDEKSAGQFEILMDLAREAGFEHYEISNFAYRGAYSRHNTSYWQDQPYLGIGPSAHSYDLLSRQWNLSNNHEYIRQIEKGIIPAERESLSIDNKYNEFILTRLRTMWGIDTKELLDRFGQEKQMTFIAIAGFQIEDELMEKQGSVYRLSPKGKYFADRIAADFFSETDQD